MFSIILLYKGLVSNGTVVRKVFLIGRRFCSSRLIRDDFKEEAKVSVRRERLTMKRIVGAISFIFFLRTVAGWRHDCSVS